MLLINNCLKFVISQIRNLMFKDVFDLNSMIISKLRGLGFYSFEDFKRDQIFFIFIFIFISLWPPVDTKIVFPSGDFSLLDLLDMCKSDDFCDSSSSSLCSTKISTIFYSFRGVIFTIYTTWWWCCWCGGRWLFFDIGWAGLRPWGWAWLGRGWVLL